MELQVIQNKIYEIRGQRVMIDRDLAENMDLRKKPFVFTELGVVIPAIV